MMSHPYGKGKVLFFNGALETDAQLTGFPAYQIAAAEAGIVRRVTCPVPTVGFTEHPGEDGSLWVVAINYASTPISCPVSFSGTLDRVYGSATIENGVLNLGANGGCVFRIK